MSEKIPFIPAEELVPEFCVSMLSESIDWSLSYINIPSAWKLSKGGGIRCAVLDTGIAPHIDLEDNVEANYNCSSALDYVDHAGHGTHSSGIIGALSNGFGIIGVAPECKITNIKILDDYGHSSYVEVEKGIRLATALGVDIISMSLGSTQTPPDSLHEAIIEANSKGIIIFAAAGNDGGKINFPAAYDECICVCAIGPDGKLAKFSSRGDKFSAVAAPGTNVFSTWCDGGFAKLSGTSESTPIVAGTGALLLAWSRNTPGVKPILGSQEMLQRIDDLCDENGRFGMHANGIGFGVPNWANFMPWKN